MKVNLCIVVADDDLDDQQLIKEAFANTNIPVTIHSVFDGVQLLDLLLKRFKYATSDIEPDLILLDLNMPVMYGMEVLKQMKNSEKLRHIPVYVITTSNSPTEKEFALALGATGFYHKGASSADIKRIVQEVCVECFTIGSK